MRTLLSFAGGATAVVAAGFAVAGFTGADAACAQGVAPRLDCPGAVAGVPGAGAPNAAVACRPVASLFRSVSVRPVGRGLRVSFSRRAGKTARVDVFQTATGSRVLGERLVFRGSGASVVRWTGRRQGSRTAPTAGGVFFVRATLRDGRRTDTRRIALTRSGGRFRVTKAFQRRDSCGALRAFKLERPAFGGSSARPVSASFRLARPGRVTVELLRGTRVVKRVSAASRTAGRTFRVRISPRGLRAGSYRVRLTYTAGGKTTTAVLTLRRV